MYHRAQGPRWQELPRWPSSSDHESFNKSTCLGGLGQYNGGVWDVDLQKSFVDRALHKNPARAKTDLALVQKGRPGWEWACQKYRLSLVLLVIIRWGVILCKKSTMSRWVDNGMKNWRYPANDELTVSLQQQQLRHQRRQKPRLRSSLLTPKIPVDDTL